MTKPRPLSMTAAALLGAAVSVACSPPPEASRYDQLVRCNAVTVIVAGALPPTFEGAGDIRAAAGRIPAALAAEAETAGKTGEQVANDIRAAALRLEADSRTGDPDRTAERLIDEARGCAALVPA